jgi:hypothetical protein
MAEKERRQRPRFEIAAGLPLPLVIVPVDEIRNGKPDPEDFLHAAAHLSVAPEECIVFGDTRPGIDAGLNAAMLVVSLLTTFSSEQLRHRPRTVDSRTPRCLKVSVRSCPLRPDWTRDSPRSAGNSYADSRAAVTRDAVALAVWKGRRVLQFVRCASMK